MPKIFITGGAGFIGSNVASYFAEKGFKVVIFDNLSRKGSKINAQQLRDKYGNQIELLVGDIKDYESLFQAIKNNEDSDAIIHLAAQVAVTTSIINPREDFEVNAIGTFNLLESVRVCKINPAIIYASTNKVYGKMEHMRFKENETRYSFQDYENGISETFNLDFHSPYGCSKGTGDQYMRDYHRIYGLNTVVFRQSCIYGYNQFGVEDQGWVAWFIIACVLNKPLTIYGNGKQVRDLLFIDDLVHLYHLAIVNIGKIRGEVFNIGGGSDFTLSLVEFLPILEGFLNKKVDFEFSEWRSGDQLVYISDIGKIKRSIGWEPHTSTHEGISKLYDWIISNKNIIDGVLK
jgi:CDP-paratose 2-epimerase